MTTLNRRLAELERQGSAAITLESSTADLCRCLARTPITQLRNEIPGIDETEWAELLAEIRVHVPTYGMQHEQH